ncbi:MAG: SDR family NAD(P)-dependent oxidoreductase [Saprospiraceae bacterium]
MNRIHVAYHGSAEGEATKLSQKLQAQGWNVFSSECGNHRSGALSEALLSFAGPTFVLINDGLLHSLNCQHGMLSTYRQIESREHTHAILASSMRNGPGNVQARVLTNLDRVSDVIRYMNYWQNAYLVKRREFGSTSTPESATALAPYREVSQEIGEFLKIVRKQKPHSVYDLIEDDGTLMQSLIGTPPAPIEPASAAVEEPVTSESEPVEELKEVETTPKEIVEERVTPAAEILTGIAAATGAVAVTKAVTEKVTPKVEVEQKTPPPIPPSESVVDPPKDTRDESLIETLIEKSKPEEVAADEQTVEVKESTPPNKIEADYFPESELEVVEEAAPEEPEVSKVVAIEPTSPIVEEVKNEEEEPTLAELVAKKARRSRKENTKQLLLLIEEDELEDAFSFAEYSLGADPGNAQLRYYYAVALLRAEEDEYTDAALYELGKLVKSDFAAEAHLCIGHVALDRRDYGMARRNLEAAYGLNKKVDDELTYRLGALIQDEYFEEPETASKYLKKATKQSTFNKEDAWYRLAQLDLQSDEPKKAKKKLKKVLKEGDKHPFAAYDLATLYLREDDVAKAHKFYLKAINANEELDTEANQAAFSLLRPVIEPEGYDESTGAFEAPVDEAAKVGQLTVLITGASSGIGAATARVFAENGHRLILTGRRVANLRALGSRLNKEFNVPIRLLSFDVTAFEETEQLLSTLPEGWNEIDVLVNNAGKAKGLDFIHQGRIEHWEEMIDTNVKGLLYMIRLVSPKMVERRSGHIINVCSTAGHEVYAKGAVYCATKHAVDAITQGVRLDLHSHGIRVSQVSPAHVEETEFAEVRFDGDSEKAEKVYKDFQPLRASDVAKSIYYIAAQPEHVNVQDVLMLSTQQANSTTIDRSGR